MRKYEVLIILKPNLGEEVEKKLLEKLLKKLSGNIVKQENWGLKKLAYPIKKTLEGSYFIFYIETEPEKIDGYKKLVNITTDVLRTLVVKHDAKWPFEMKTTKDMIIRERKRRIIRKKGPYNRGDEKSEQKDDGIKVKEDLKESNKDA